MKLSYKWLSEYVDLSGISPEELAEKMTTAGLEVEGIEPMAKASGIVIGEVMECEDIEGTHLHKTQTRISDTETYQIVCGAPNCRKGLKVIVALPGAELPGGKINPKPLHGVESNGMLCALYELGVDKKVLSEKQINGIEELPADAPVGEKNVLGYLGLDDTILDVSLTPNRADCSAMWNMAREVGAIVHRDVKWPQCQSAADEGRDSDFKVETKTKNCSFYAGKVVNHVKVGSSPEWMVRYLHAYGMNSINNVVDISNFVMLETGQPLHYYDLSKLKGRNITVVDGITTKMTALDGNTFDIIPEDLLIETNGEPTGIAGIMGGEESMIDENTTSIFIEAAHFNHASIRHTATRLALMTEAAQRFIKEFEPLAWHKAMDRSVQLLKEYAEASDFERTVTAGEEGYSPLVVKETLSHCNGLLGTDFKMNEVTEVLKWLDFNPEINGEEITCHIPSYRIDIEGAADIDEEIIRLLGYDSLGSTLPQITATVGQLSPKQSFRRLTRQVMESLDLSEIVTYTLVSEKYVNNTFDPAGEPIALAMPMSESRKYIRTGLMNSVLECVQYNRAHQNENNNFYEISKVYGKDKEEERLAVVLDGTLREDKLHKTGVTGDFYAMKGILTTWLERAGYTAARIQVKPNKTDLIHFHPYRSAELWLDKNKLGVFGEVHPAYAAEFDLKRVVYAEMKVDLIFSSRASRLKFNALDKYPAVSRDIAFTVDKDVTAKQILDSVRKNGRKIVKSSEIFDIYEGQGIEEGKKSVAMRIVYQSENHTLKEEEINEAHQGILDGLKKQVKAELRA